MSKKGLPYQYLASYYDTMGADRFSTRMVEYTDKILKRLHHRPKTVLDLCCGTGTAACLFANEGLRVVGLDRSTEMLKAARKKARGRGLKIEFVNQELPGFEIRRRGEKSRRTFDLITCFFDSMNYMLTEGDLRLCFENVKRHLNPGGLFIYDMNTGYMLKTTWVKSRNCGCTDHHAWVWPTWYDEKSKIAHLDAVFFIKKGKTWERYQEHHMERAYPNTVLKRLLRQSGLEVRHLYHCLKFRRPTAKSDRICLVAQKK
jgi:SAM-dependent methyltransferase